MTDYSKMTGAVQRAFVRLRKDKRIYARMNLPCCFSCAYSTVTRKMGKKWRGWAFTMREDAERMNETGWLWIAFGAHGRYRQGYIDDRAVGRTIRSALEAEGLVVDWDDNPDVRIKVKVMEE